MTRTSTVLGMAVLFILGIMAAPAYADLNTDSKTCKESHVLVERTNGKMACLTEKTAEKAAERFGWIILASESVTDKPKSNSKHSDLADSVHTQDNIRINPTSQTPKSDTTEHILMTDDKDPVELSDKKITMTNPVRDRVILSELGDTTYWPKFNMTFPEQVRIGEPFDVVYDYTYVIPDEDTQRYTHPEEQCSADTCERHSFQISIPTYVGFEHKSIDISTLVETEKHVLCYTDCPYEPVKVWSLNGTDTEYTPFRSYNAYTYDPLFDNTKELQEIFTFTINEPDIDYRYGKIRVTIHGDGSGIFYFYAAPDGIVYLDDDLLQSVGEGSGQLKKTSTGGNHITAEERAQRPPADGPPREVWEEYAEHLRSEVLRQYYAVNYTVNGVFDYEQLLLDDRITQSWIDEFFAAYPEFATQFVLPTLHWILPQAFAAEDHGV